jgi:3-mercaptopyruvate sulfurtransferase SseA
MTALVQNLSRISTAENIETVKNTVAFCGIGLIAAVLLASV